MANPFARLGDYRDSTASPSEETFSLGYLTGNPDVREIEDAGVSLIFKSLMKKDPRTKQRALADFGKWIDDCQNIPPNVHLAFVQIYLKLFSDLDAILRRQAHECLGKMYTNLGRASTKYMRHVAGPWLAGTCDIDHDVAISADSSLNAVFPGDKRGKFVETFRAPIAEFIEVACKMEPGFLSDERQISRSDSLQRCARLVKTAIDLIGKAGLGFSDPRIAELNVSGKLWSFVSSQDVPLAKSVLSLASTTTEPSKALWREMVNALRRSSPFVAVDVLRTLILVTRERPDMWDQNSVGLASQLPGNSSHAIQNPQFWPLWYNLVLSVPDDILQVPPLVRVLDKTVPKTIGAAEPAAWGCYGALAVRMDFFQRFLDAVLARCRRPVSAGLREALGRRFEVFGGQIPLEGPPEYLKVLAMAHKFRSSPPPDNSQLAELVRLDPDMNLPEMEEPSPKWAEIAAYSTKLDPQAVCEVLVTHGMASAVLKQHAKLALRGVHLSLGPHCQDLALGIEASPQLVSREDASAFIMELSEQAETDPNSLKQLVNVAARNPIAFEYIDDVTKQRIVHLEPDDPSGALARLVLSDLTWEDLREALTVPIEAESQYEVRLWQFGPYNAVKAQRIVAAAEALSGHDDTETATKVALVQSAIRGWNYAMGTTYSDLPLQPLGDYAIAWDLTLEDSALAFHAAQILWPQDFPSQADRREFEKSSVRGALWAQSGSFRGQPWFDRFAPTCERQWALLDKLPSSVEPKTDLERAWAHRLGRTTEKLEGPGFVRLEALKAGSKPTVNDLLELEPESSPFDVDLYQAYLDAFDGYADPRLFGLLESKSKILPWIAYKGLRTHPDPQTIRRLASKNGNPAIWCLFADLALPSEEVYERILGWIGENLEFVELPHNAEVNPKNPGSIVAHLLLSVALHSSGELRTWYRDIRDRSLQKRVDQALATVVTPAVMRSLVEMTKKREGIVVSEKAREVRGVREVEDLRVEVVIALPDQYPAKPATVEIRNLAGVPEGKKRLWLLEARQNVQRRGVLQAMDQLLTKVGQFLDGIEPCAICYSTTLDNKTLPSKTCGTCHNVYHTDCLYRWFNSNRDKLCPMCRQQM